MPGINTKVNELVRSKEFQDGLRLATQKKMDCGLALKQDIDKYFEMKKFADSDESVFDLIYHEYVERFNVRMTPESLDFDIGKFPKLLALKNSILDDIGKTPGEEKELDCCENNFKACVDHIVDKVNTHQR